MEKSLQDVVGPVPQQLGGNRLPHLASSPLNGPKEERSWANRTDKPQRHMNRPSVHSKSFSSSCNDSSVLSTRNQGSVDETSGFSGTEFNSSLSESDIRITPSVKSSKTVATHELMRHAGIGRGKVREKTDIVNSSDSQKISSCDLLNNLETSSTLCSSEFLNPTREKVNCNIVSPKEISPGFNNNNKDVKQNAAVTQELHNTPMQTQSQVSQFSANEAGVKNATLGSERFREHDFRKIHNGFDMNNRGYKGRPYRPNRFPNNNPSPLHYKSSDNRTFPPHYPQSHLKGMRPVKSSDTHLRYNDAKKNHSVFLPSQPEIDRMTHAKSRASASNENFIDANRISQNNVISHSESRSPVCNADIYVPQGTQIVYKTKSLCNKDDNMNIHSKSNVVSCVSNTSTVNCHGKSVTSVKSLDSCICGSCSDSKCSSSEVKKNCECLLQSKPCHNCKPNPSDNLGEPDVPFSHRKEIYGPANYNSVLYNSQGLIASKNNVEKNENCEKLVSISQWASNVKDVSPASYGHRNQSEEFHQSNVLTCSPYAAMSQSPVSSNTDFHGKSNSSQQKNSGNIELPTVSSSDSFSSDATHCLPVFASMNSPMPGVISVSQSSYADIMRMPVSSVSKISVSHVLKSTNSFPSMSSSPDSIVTEDVVKNESTHPNMSSEWVISRLSQVKLDSTGSSSLNGIHRHSPTSNQEGVKPRPIAVSVEKPSFYNSTTVGKLNTYGNQLSLSAVEAKMLESQYGDSQLCNKTSEKLTLLSETCTTVPSTCEQSNIYASMRTDSVFSDSSSVCSSSSSLFKNELHGRGIGAKINVPPVVIMNNCMSLESVSDISFGIEYDEIMEICSGSAAESTVDVSTLSGSELCSNSALNTPVSEKEVSLLESDRSFPKDNNVCSTHLNVFTIGNKKMLWKDEEVDITRCNMLHIVDFLHEAWCSVEKAIHTDGQETTSVKYYYGDE